MSSSSASDNAGIGRAGAAPGGGGGTTPTAAVRVARVRHATGRDTELAAGSPAVLVVRRRPGADVVRT
ncbi:MAG TPA: hypothetical protein VGP96_08215 [Candidatus Dormibacteraeota bacterium]|nr:hypothetical protein [Candidatus Dormibacteraeota bacterium]